MASRTFLVIFSASLSGDDFVLFDLSDGNCAYLQMFYATLQFCVQVKFATLDGNTACLTNSQLKVATILMQFYLKLINLVVCGRINLTSSAVSSQLCCIMVYGAA